MVQFITYYLQGQSPQEHRNMPYDDAMGLLAKSFEDGGSGGGKGGKESGSQKVGPNDDVPNDIRTCVGFFMDRRPLSGTPTHTPLPINLLDGEFIFTRRLIKGGQGGARPFQGLHR